MIKTKYEADLLLEELSLLEASVFKQAGKELDLVLNSDIRSWVAEIIKKELKEEKDGIVEYVNRLKKDIENTPEVKVIIAFELSSSMETKIYENIQSSLKEKIVLDLIFDRQIIGGMIIIYKGKYKDFSFRRVFNTELDKTRGDILQTLNKHAV